MRISDWSSDVCSSDLRLFVVAGLGDAALRQPQAARQGRGAGVLTDAGLEHDEPSLRGFRIGDPGASENHYRGVDALGPERAPGTEQLELQVLRPLEIVAWQIGILVRQSIRRRLEDRLEPLREVGRQAHYGTPGGSGHWTSSPSVGTVTRRSEEHTSELQSLMRISYAVFCLKKKNNTHNHHSPTK